MNERDVRLIVASLKEAVLEDFRNPEVLQVVENLGLRGGDVKASIAKAIRDDMDREIKGLRPVLFPALRAFVREQIKSAPGLGQFNFGAILNAALTSVVTVGSAVGATWLTQKLIKPPRAPAPQQAAPPAPSEPTVVYTDTQGRPVAPGYAQAPAQMPSWVLPAALVGGGALVLLTVLRRR